MDANKSSLLLNVIDRTDGYEYDIVSRFGEQLIRLAHSEMPERMSRRLDPEDVVQSVFRSFFGRHEREEFTFQSSNDVWRLLVTMTYHKVVNAINHHHRQKRDIKRDTSESDSSVSSPMVWPDRKPTSSDVVVMIDLLESLMLHLPEESREIVRFRLEDYTSEEIAQRLGKSKRTVMRVLRRFRELAEARLQSDISMPEENGHAER
ncbi:MAG: sigma-70 family RNA polymerase sigma factor [Planctomycetaceae bacterium]|nr:sigma-70 family RNA polymerase sigma factor [Planctomycetaceae bacterium]